MVCFARERARAVTHAHTLMQGSLDFDGHDDVSPQKGWMAGSRHDGGWVVGWRGSTGSGFAYFSLSTCVCPIPFSDI